MYDLTKEKNETGLNQSLESMQEITLLSEMMTVQNPIVDSENVDRVNLEWFQVKNEKICSNIQEMLSDSTASG